MNKIVLSHSEKFFTPTFLARSFSLSLKKRHEQIIALSLSLSLSSLQQFDLNTSFSRISLSVSNTLPEKFPIKKDALPILPFRVVKKTAPQYNLNSLNCEKDFSNAPLRVVKRQNPHNQNSFDCKKALHQCSFRFVKKTLHLYSSSHKKECPDKIQILLILKT